MDRQLAARRLVESLSNREREILTMVARGMSNSEIGCRLFLGTATIKEYVSTILSKLGVRNRVQAALIGYGAGLLPCPSVLTASADHDDPAVVDDLTTVDGSAFDATSEPAGARR